MARNAAGPKSSSVRKDTVAYCTTSCPHATARGSFCRLLREVSSRTQRFPNGLGHQISHTMQDCFLCPPRWQCSSSLLTRLILGALKIMPARSTPQYNPDDPSKTITTFEKDKAKLKHPCSRANHIGPKVLVQSLLSVCFIW